MRQESSSRTQRGRRRGTLDTRLPANAAADYPSATRSTSPMVHQAVIVLIGIVVFCTNLGSAALFDMDEALYATCAREMTQRGDWVVPWFNGELFPDKPPLMFWLMMAGRELLGPTELAVRLHSALFGIATALATYHLGRLLFCREVGFWAGAIVSTSIVFTISARAATVDSALTFAITAAMLTFVAASPAWQGRDLPHRWLAFVLMYAFIGVAVLAKGPVGAIMPLGAMGLFLLMVDRLPECPRPPQATTPRWAARLPGWLRPVLGQWRRFTPPRVVRAGWRLRPLMALLVVGAIALPWYVLVGLRTDGRWLEGFLGMTLGPAVKAIQGHSGPWFYHLLVVFIGFFPWSVFLGPTLVAAVRRVRADHPWRSGYVLALCWAAAVIGLWSAVALKLPHHILPAYPALALLTAPFVYTWITEPQSASRWWMRNAAITLVVVGVGISVALPIVAMFLLPGEEWIGLAGLPLVVGGVACLWFSEQDQTQRTMAAFTATAVVFLTAGFGVAVLGVDRHQNGPLLAAALRRAESGPLELASFRFFRESFVYYTGARVERIHREKDLDAFLARSAHPFVITTDEHEPMIRRRYGGRVRVLQRQQRFLDTGQLVVLEWTPPAASRTAKTPPQRTSR